MENNIFKSVAFGGFDKQDVIGYIERTAREAAEAQEKLQQENDGLRQETQALGGQVSALQAKLEALEAENTRLQESLARESARREELEALRPEAERLRAQAEALRGDAESYARFREQIGAIECEARKRADDLETASARQMKKTVDSFRIQYDALMRTFESAAVHVTEELRKIEVSLSQLPRVMDRSGAELEQLTAGLECPTEEAGT